MEYFIFAIMQFVENSFDIDSIFCIENEQNFNTVSLAVFEFQKKYCSVYKSFVEMLPKYKQDPKHYTEIPFLPISFFKKHTVLHQEATPDFYFESSGTTLETTSKHYIAAISVYEKSFTKGFQQFFGEISDYCIIGLLPNYLERKHSSLVYMVHKLMQLSGNKNNGFYLYEYQELKSLLKKLNADKQKTIVFGVSFSLLDFSELSIDSSEHIIYIETGGMKGRKKEMTKPELLLTLQQKLHTQKLYSEYGMTELLSQAYSFGNNYYNTPNWMKILVRENDNPFQMTVNQTGGINIIDLANVYSCSFIATQDMGKVYENNSFELIGRMDNSDIRGCSLMVS